jgi:hypothetical protein
MHQPGQLSGSSQGLAEVGHELTHVQQQSGGLLTLLGGYVRLDGQGSAKATDFGIEAARC